MKLNTKTRYGLRAITAIAMNTTEGGILQKDISKSENISNKYLDQIISELKSADLIMTVSGKKSGYRLTKPANKISVYTIFKAFNPPLQLLDCLNNHDECIKNKFCSTQTFWSGLNTVIIKYLESKTLEEIVKEQKILDKKNQDIMFYI